jgi:hypothetical protein
MTNIDSKATRELSDVELAAVSGGDVGEVVGSVVGFAVGGPIGALIGAGVGAQYGSTAGSTANTGDGGTSQEHRDYRLRR